MVDIKNILVAENETHRLAVLRWTASLLGLSLFFVWSPFLLEHMEWFAKGGELPPARVYFGYLAHTVMLLGFIVALRCELTGSIFIIAGSFILFSRINSSAFIIFFIASSVPACLFLVHWFKTGWETSVLKTLMYDSGDRTGATRKALRSVPRWMLRIAGTFISVLIAAYWFGGEVFFVFFKPGEGWSMTISKGFPNPFSMTAPEIALFCLSAAVIAGFLAAWKWEITGGAAVVLLSVLYALIARDATAYPVLPAAPVTGVLFVLTDRFMLRLTEAKRDIGATPV